MIRPDDDAEYVPGPLMAAITAWLNHLEAENDALREAALGTIDWIRTLGVPEGIWERRLAALVGNERPPESTFREFQRLHGLDDGS